MAIGIDARHCGSRSPLIAAEGRAARSSLLKVLRLAAVSAAALALANCASSGPGKNITYDSQQSREFGAFKDKRYGKASPKVAQDGQTIPKGGGRYQVGKAYKINGRVYRPYVKPTGFTQVGSASWYGAAFHGRKTANGEIYDRRSFTAAHPTMPLPSYARVTNLRNGYSIVVRVNDRGPYHGGRVIDLSERTAEALDYKSSGTARVKVAYLGAASLGGSDDRQLLASLRRDGAPADLDGFANVAAAEPAFTPAPKRATAVAARERIPVRQVADAGALPGFETVPPVKVETLSDAPAPRKGKRVPLAEEEAPAAPVTVADATEDLSPALALAPVEPAAAVEGTEVSSEALSALYFAQNRGADQPAAGWAVTGGQVEPLGAPMLHDGGGYIVAAGLYRNLRNAERLARIMDGGAPVTVTAVSLQGRKAYSVSVGPFGSQAEAKAALRRAVSAGADGARLRRG